MNDFEKICELENVMLPVINRIKAFDKIVFYGLGFDLKFNFSNYVAWLGKPAFIVDKSEGGTVYNGIEVVNSLSDVCKTIEEKICVIITAPTYREEIAFECRKYLPEDAIFKHLVPLSQNSPDYREFIRGNKENVNIFYQSLSDEISKLTLENYLCGKISNDLKWFVKVCIPNKAMNTCRLSAEELNYPSIIKDEQTVYFPDDIFKLAEDEVFIDCGASYGDTLSDFIDKTKGKFAAAVCVELGPSNYNRLTEAAEKANNVYCVNAGVWNEESSIEVRKHETSISIAMNESPPIHTQTAISVPLRKIDGILTEMNIVPTLIKMDIEGAELMALKGAENTIKTHKPKLAVCVYHKDEDIIEIPAYLKSLNSKYRFYLRKYSTCSSELVLFAI